MITALVHYKEWREASHALLDDYLVDKSKVVEVDKLTDINEMFSRITKIDILKEENHDSN